MEPWAVVAIVVASLVLIGFLVGVIKRVVFRVPDHEISAEGPPRGEMKSVRSRFRNSRFRGRRGASIDMADTESDDSDFDIR